MNWKDLLYFQKKDKIATILLSFICLILGGSYIVYSNLPSNYDSLQAKTFDEFDNYQKQLQPRYTSVSSADNSSTKSQAKKHVSKNNKKLKEGQSIDINKANEKALQRIPGIGVTFAQRIIEYRGQLGGFLSPEQLMEIKGITEKKFIKISPYVSINSRVQKIKINNPNKITHPYLSTKQINALSKHIDSGKRISSIDDLYLLNEFSPRDISRIEQYISFN